MARARGRSRGRPTDYEWDLAVFQHLAQAAGSAGTNLLIADGAHQTIHRLRGEVLVWLDGTPAAGDTVRIGMGIHVVPEDSGAVVTVDPLTDVSASDWMWYTVLHLGSEDTTPGGDDIIKAARIVIDSKAMRRIKSQQELQFVVENATVTGGTAQSVNVAGAVRVLSGS